MSRLNKVFILFFVIILFTSCSSKQTVTTNNANSSVKGQTNAASSNKKQPEKTQMQEIKFVPKKEKTKFLLTNGIITEYKESILNVPNVKVTLSYPQISGLVNKNLEQKINQTLANDIQKAAQKYYKPSLVSSKMKNDFIYVHNHLSVNNLVSFTLYSNQPIAGFLYRLNDGIRLSLKDIFTEGTDYAYLLNQKVIEGILRDGLDEENILKGPFSSIKPDQDFVLSSTDLTLIFHQGEGNFVENCSINIPLAEIDDYVVAFDIYSGTERKNHEKTNLIVRNNNIFTTLKTQLLKNDNIKIPASFYEVSGLRNNEFEVLINKTIQDGIAEAADKHLFEKLSPNQDVPDAPAAEIRIDERFNHYGILTFVRDVLTFESYDVGQNLFKVYSFDLVNKKIIDTKNILTNYIKKQKGLQDIFTEKIKEQIKGRYDSNDKLIDEKTIDSIDYSFILNNSTIYFLGYFSSNDIQIAVRFNKNCINGVKYNLSCYVPLSSILRGTLEDFFAS